MRFVRLSVITSLKLRCKDGFPTREPCCTVPDRSLKCRTVPPFWHCDISPMSFYAQERIVFSVNKDTSAATPLNCIVGRVEKIPLFGVSAQTILILI